MHTPCGGNDFDRQEMIRNKLRDQDEREALATGDCREIIAERLVSLGYSEEEVGRDVNYAFLASGKEEHCKADFLVRVQGRPFMAIKCSMAVDSRERHVLALARVVDEYVIPMALVTDGLKAHILESRTGRLLSESLEDMLTREEAQKLLADTAPFKLDEARRTREAQVLAAFEVLACPEVPETEAKG